MVNKLWATVIVAVIFGVSSLGFVGVGFGLNALSITSNNCNTATPNSNCLSYSNESAYEGTITTGIAAISIDQGAQFVSALEPNQPSTGFTFGMQVSSTGDCSPGNLRSDAWQAGYQGYYEIQFPQTVTLSIDGAVSTIGSTFFINENYSASGVGASQGNLIGCAQNVGGSGGEIPGPYSNNHYDHTIRLMGIYPIMKFSISFTTSGLYCDGAIGGQLTNQCYALEQSPASNGGVESSVDNNGGWWITSTLTGIVLTAEASFHLTNTQNYYNGGVLSIMAYTYFGGSGVAKNGETNGYSVVVDMPSARGGGTAPWQSNPQPVPNYCLSGCPITWNIPKNASVPDGGNPALDVFSVILLSSLNVGQDTQTPIINPYYAPTTPVITYTSSGAGIYPAVGDQVTLTVYSNQTATSGPLTVIDLIGYYLGPTQGVEQSPGCGNAYITFCNGTPINVSHQGNGIVGTFYFTVTPPIGDTQIGIEAISSSNNSPSLPGWLLISIKPSDCPIGATCDPLQTQTSTWQVIGPILLSIAIVSGLLLAALWIPWKYAVILLPGIGVVIVLLLALTGGYHAMFMPGGVLNQNVGG